MRTKNILFAAATAAMLVTANLVTKTARADITSFPYTNNIINSIDVSDWTLSGMNYTPNYSGSLHFGTDGYVIMPELSVGVGVVPSVQITALFGDYIELHTSSDGGSTYTYHADFTGGENSQVSVRACPAGTRFIKFVVKSGYANYPYLQALTITLQTVDVTGVTLNKPSTTLVMAEGGTETLTATVEPNDATNQVVTWDSDNTAVATVNNGEIAAVAPGTATITVTTADGNFTAECAVTVSATRVAATGVTLNKATTTLFAGGSTETLTPLFTPNDATNKNVSWISSAPSIASVSNGVVTPEAVGNATITVTTVDGSFTAACAVTVKEPTLDTVRIAWTSGSKNISYTASSTVTVDWGDGSAVETFGSGSNTASTASAYDAPGAYTATIAGTDITALEILASNYALAVDVSKAPNLTALDCDGNLITDGNLRLNSNPALMVAAGGNYLSAAALNTLGFQLDCSGCGPQTFSAIATVGTPVALKVNIDIYDDATVMYNNASAASGVDFTISGNNITFLKEGAYRFEVNTALSGSPSVTNYVTVVSGYTEQRIAITLDTKGSADSTVFALNASYGKPFTVDWGDGVQQTYYGTGEKAPIGNTAGMSPLSLKHKYTTAGTQNVSITAPFGTLLTALDAKHEDGYSVFTALDVTQAPALERLQCNNHKLATLDLLKNPWLGLIHCGYNRLTQLQLNIATGGVAKFNGAGIQVQCQRNLLTSLAVGAQHFVENCSGNAMGLQQLYDLRQALAVNGSSSVFGTQNKWLSGAANTPIPLVEPAELGASTATVVTVKDREGTTASGSDYTYTQGTGITFTAADYYTVELTNAAITASGATKLIYNINAGMPAQSIAFDWAAASAATVKTVTLEANERDFTVGWGDGNTETFAGEDIGTTLTLSHTYDDAGDYTVSIDAADDFGTFYALDLSNTELTSLTTLTAPLLTSLNLSNNSLTLENLKDIKASVPVSVSITYGLQTLPQVTTAVNIEHVIDNVYGNSSLASVKKIQLASSGNAAGGDYTWTQGDGKIKFNGTGYVYEVTLENYALSGAQVKYTFVVGNVPFPNVKVTFRISDPAEKVNLYAGTIPVGALVTVSYGDGRPNATIVGNGVYTQVIANNLSYAAPGSYTITCTANNINDHFARVSISNSTAKSVILDGSGEPSLTTFVAQQNYFDTLTFAGCTYLVVP
ncbi:hypothetical protein FACS1894156_6690 [Bacteroidia bacterium]|nr:hypothetical protein FACS1894156_6690 [Bacteroidia bacterium]